MIDEAVGKILGMAMAYAVSSLGLWLAYVNYRRRVLGAERVMTRRAWTVLATVVVAVAVAVWIVASLVRPQPPVASVAPSRTPTLQVSADRPRTSAVGLLVPGAVFLVATGITWRLYRHFASGGERGS